MSYAAIEDPKQSLLARPGRCFPTLTISALVISVFALAISMITIVAVTRPHSQTLGAVAAPPPRVSSYLGNMDRVSCAPSSTDTAGSIKAYINGPGDFNVHVVFGQSFSTAPRSILLTPGTRFISGTLWVVYLRTTGFLVIGNFANPSNDPDATLLYYQVIA